MRVRESESERVWGNMGMINTPLVLETLGLLLGSQQRESTAEHLRQHKIIIRNYMIMAADTNNSGNTLI